MQVAIAARARDAATHVAEKEDNYNSTKSHYTIGSAANRLCKYQFNYVLISQNVCFLHSISLKYRFQKFVVILNCPQHNLRGFFLQKNDNRVFQKLY